MSTAARWHDSKDPDQHRTALAELYPSRCCDTRTAPKYYNPYKWSLRRWKATWVKRRKKCSRDRSTHLELVGHCTSRESWPGRTGQPTSDRCSDSKAGSAQRLSKTFDYAHVSARLMFRSLTPYITDKILSTRLTTEDIAKGVKNCFTNKSSHKTDESRCRKLPFYSFHDMKNCLIGGRIKGTLIDWQLGPWKVIKKQKEKRCLVRRCVAHTDGNLKIWVIGESLFRVDLRRKIFAQLTSPNCNLICANCCQRQHEIKQCYHVYLIDCLSNIPRTHTQSLSWAESKIWAKNVRQRNDELLNNRKREVYFVKCR